MPKVTGPLFSPEAHGALSDVLTYQNRPGGATVYKYTKPKVPLTLAQHNQREKIRWCVESWQSLSAAGKAIWEDQGKGQSGYSYFIKQTVGYMFDPSVALFLPLWMPELSGSPFLSRDSYGHTCTVTGALWTPQGRSFDGNDKILMGEPASLKLTSSMTLMAWIKPDNTTDSTIQRPIISKNGGVRARAYDLIYKKNAQQLLDFRIAADKDTNVSHSLPINPIHNSFHFICGVYDAAAQTMDDYLDGNLAGASKTTGVPSSQFSDNGEEVKLSYGTVTNTYYLGIIGETMIFNRALTSQEIQHIYLATKWRF